MNEILKQIVIGVSSIGGWVAITYLLSSWIGARLAQKLNIHWIKQKEKEVEKLKSDLTRDRDILNNTMSVISKQYQISQEKRLKSLEDLWETIIKIREFFEPLQFLFTILLPDEYNSAIKDKFNSSLSSITSVSVSDLIKDTTHSVEISRPYIGIKLWSLFFVYRAFVGRIIVTFNKGRKENNIEAWYSDKNTVDLLRLILEKEELEKIRKNKFMFLNQAVDSLERKILNEMESVLTGISISEFSTDQADKIIRKIKKMNLENKSM